MFDCIIIGTGVAGVSAALTLKALKKNFLLIGNPELSLKVRSAEEIRNYPGLSAVSGEEMKSAFLTQLKGEGIEITEGKVNGVYPTDGGYSVLCGRQSYEARTVVLATGVQTLKAVAGEEKFLGRGVSYCAVCDGFLYKGKDIAVFVESAEDVSEVELLAGYARTIYLFVGRRGVSAKGENIVAKEGAIAEIRGGMRVEEVVTASGEILPVDGVFMLRQSVAADTLVHGLKTENGRVTVDRECATNLAGIFAAGDITGRPYQYAKAAGEGNVCAYSVNAYLKNAELRMQN